MDRRKLASELTRLNILSLYDFMSPFDYSSEITSTTIKEREECAEAKYLFDHIFKARVDKLVSMTMQLIDQAKL